MMTSVIRRLCNIIFQVFSGKGGKVGLTTACCCYLCRPQSQICDDDDGDEDDHDHDHDVDKGDDDDDAVVISAAHALSL